MVDRGHVTRVTNVLNLWVDPRTFVLARGALADRTTPITININVQLFTDQYRVPPSETVGYTIYLLSTWLTFIPTTDSKITITILNQITISLNNKTRKNLC